MFFDRFQAIAAALEMWKPRWGWHDDHAHFDGTARYLPAIQQVREEFLMLAQMLDGRNLLSGRALQLGVGETGASHEVWRLLFDRGAVTLDFNGLYVDTTITSGGSTHDAAMRDLVRKEGPFDFLFIDAGHDYFDVRTDYKDYAQMIVSGGVIAFHDALFRKTYPEVEVWRFLQTLDGVTHLCASDVGVAYVVKG